MYFLIWFLSSSQRKVQRKLEHNISSQEGINSRKMEMEWKQKSRESKVVDPERNGASQIALEDRDDTAVTSSSRRKPKNSNLPRKTQRIQKQKLVPQRKSKQATRSTILYLLI